MARNALNCYVWLVDTLRRHQRLTLSEINRLWENSNIYDGHALPRRTFHHWRHVVEDMFDINIMCDRSTYEYYIEQSEGQRLLMQNWLLDAMAMSDMLSQSHDLTERIVLENVPSARQHLPTIIEAMRNNIRIKFSYRSFARTLPVNDIVFEPYFTKIFKQRWYVIGRTVADNKVKTYALERMTALRLCAGESFTIPRNLSPDAFFADCFGIITNHNATRDIVLRVEPRQAKYFRALPLHPSQREQQHDSYSIFRYRMRLTYDLLEELLSHGPTVEVLEPPELKTQVVEALRQSLEHYLPAPDR